MIAFSSLQLERDAFTHKRHQVDRIAAETAIITQPLLNVMTFFGNSFTNIQRVELLLSGLSCKPIPINPCVPQAALATSPFFGYSISSVESPSGW